ncbi:hypothetical protein [Cedratvirus kamchatka]|uniref:Uncharacterized protein n=1 Tax=Cedratvirus kamchatka TaxID=2716914 RepID=A0A6G8MZ36_9VIRU|nr:hypothetical protein [Cedratvirus kamchatka]
MLLFLKKIDKDMIKYLLSSDINIASSCDRCDDRKGYGAIKNVGFLLNYIRRKTVYPCEDTLYLEVKKAEVTINQKQSVLEDCINCSLM